MQQSCRMKLFYLSFSLFSLFLCLYYSQNPRIFLLFCCERIPVISTVFHSSFNFFCYLAIHTKKSPEQTPRTFCQSQFFKYTAVGVLTSDSSEPMPSCLYRLLPTERSTPSLDRYSVLNPPAATASTFSASLRGLS